MDGYCIGIDEAGRGPLAGPVSVGAVLLAPHFDRSLIASVKDSKKLTETAREAWYGQMLLWQKEGSLRFSVAYTSAERIDRLGIVWAVTSALSRALSKLEAPSENSLVLLDGGLRAPEMYVRQQTIIRGDASEPVIALASIAAKVRRDRLMKRLAKQYPGYDFEVHKGYGTKKHQAAIAQLGLSDMHRRTFCRSLQVI